MNRKLSRREKLALALAAAALAAFLVLQLAVFPLARQRQRLARQVEAQTAALGEMRALGLEYASLQTGGQRLKEHLAARRPGFSLFSFVEAMAGRTGLKPHIAYLRPSTGRQRADGHEVSRVEMQLKDIDLDQLVRYLHGVESSSDLVYVNRLSISRSAREGGKIDVVLEVETFET